MNVACPGCAAVFVKNICINPTADAPPTPPPKAIGVCIRCGTVMQFDEEGIPHVIPETTSGMFNVKNMEVIRRVIRENRREVAGP